VTVIHSDQRALAIISNRWFAADEASWRALFAFAKRYALSFLTLIRQRMRVLRDLVARVAFERQQDLCVVAWEMREALLLGRGGAGVCDRGGAQVRGSYQYENNAVPAGRESLST
jgi:hypothetical protein